MVHTFPGGQMCGPIINQFPSNVLRLQQGTWVLTVPWGRDLLVSTFPVPHNFFRCV